MTRRREVPRASQVSPRFRCNAKGINGRGNSPSNNVAGNRRGKRVDSRRVTWLGENRIRSLSMATEQLAARHASPFFSILDPQDSIPIQSADVRNDDLRAETDASVARSTR